MDKLAIFLAPSLFVGLIGCSPPLPDQITDPTADPGPAGEAQGPGAGVAQRPTDPGSDDLVHSVDLAWGASPSPMLTQYDVHRGTTSGGPYAPIGSVAATLTAYTDLTVDAGATYYYVVTAVNASALVSPYSNEIEAVIPSP